MTALTLAQQQELDSSLESGFAELARVIEPLTAEQWKWTPDPAVWSISMCCEHIGRTESGILDRLDSAGSEGVELAAGKDDFVTRAVTSRKRKVSAPENMIPTGDAYERPADFLTVFRTIRNRARDKATCQETNLRAICAPHFALKELDGYQWLLMTSAHLRRHLGQINELMAMPGFPR